jgi:ribonuclease VapC
VIVLDASAVLALLFDEAGADRVRAALDDAAISAATLTEIITKALRRGISSDDAYFAILDWDIEIVPVDTPQARVAAEMSKAPRELDLSMGDRLCIALALIMDVGLMTSDRGILRLDAGIPYARFR